MLKKYIPRLFSKLFHNSHNVNHRYSSIRFFNSSLRGIASFATVGIFPNFTPNEIIGIIREENNRKLFLSNIMRDGGRPSERVSSLLSNQELKAAVLAEISRLTPDYKDQLFYSITTGYRSELGRLDEELTATILKNLIPKSNELELAPRKIEYGFINAIKSKEEELAKICVRLFAEANIDLNKLVNSLQLLPPSHFKKDDKENFINYAVKIINETIPEANIKVDEYFIDKLLLSTINKGFS